MHIYISNGSDIYWTKCKNEDFTCPSTASYKNEREIIDSCLIGYHVYNRKMKFGPPQAVCCKFYRDWPTCLGSTRTREIFCLCPNTSVFGTKKDLCSEEQDCTPTIKFIGYFFAGFIAFAILMFLIEYARRRYKKSRQSVESNQNNQFSFTPNIQMPVDFFTNNPTIRRPSYEEIFPDGQLHEIAIQLENNSSDRNSRSPPPPYSS